MQAVHVHLAAALDELGTVLTHPDFQRLPLRVQTSLLEATDQLLLISIYVNRSGTPPGTGNP
ncbi:hypothetical protein LCGC14_1689650 [marine sediment metagenome]|uniref:Uncharacterized protein n=1 Tax=marine sediment metagenome TaxID=412755 RepID=A0A0F9I8T6_9ZZZZ